MMSFLRYEERVFGSIIVYLALVRTYNYDVLEYYIN